MTRNFTSGPMDRSLLEELCLLARKAPSAGFSQGAEFIILDRSETLEAFWDTVLPAPRREHFAWPGLLKAPAVVLPAADSRRYLARYSEDDKVWGATPALGASTGTWPMPYWLIDCAFAVQNLLLAAAERGLGALFFGLFTGESEVRAALGVPEGVELLGAVALGRPAADRPSRSTERGWRAPAEVLHWGAWQGAHR